MESGLGSDAALAKSRRGAVANPVSTTRRRGWSVLLVIWLAPFRQLCSHQWDCRSFRV